MIKVITYGTYDLLHYGHIKLLERAKALGDYLIVGITADDFDKTRGKINVQQSLMERIEAVRATGVADEIIVEEYEGQKIDDIKRYGIDIFTVGSDWKGKFDYLNEYCKVIYLDRTKGISSSELRTEKRNIKIGFVGESQIIGKFIRECNYVNGLAAYGIYSRNNSLIQEFVSDTVHQFNTYDELLYNVDAVYIISQPEFHYEDIKKALLKKVNVLCESPITLDKDQCDELFRLAEVQKCILMESIKTAYSMAYHRMLLLIKTGIIGDVVSVNATCTSMRYIENKPLEFIWNSINSWGPTTMLPVFQILGTDYIQKQIYTVIENEKYNYDSFTKIDFCYKSAVASIIVGQGVKSEGNLVVAGTKGYIYVPAPWWKTEYFEIRFEDQGNNRRYFYQLDGEGIRYELVSFIQAVNERKEQGNISHEVTRKITEVIDDYYRKKNTILLEKNK